MKKKLEAELISIAHRVLRMKGKGDVSQLHAEVKKLYEQLTVLKFVEEHLGEEAPALGEKAIYETMDEVFEEKNQDELIKHNLKDYNEPKEPREEIITPVMDTIKDIVAEMPKEETLEDILGVVVPEPKFVKKDADDVTPRQEDIKVALEPKTINDRVIAGLQIGLNDRIAFVKHLFNGNQEDYNRVVSQINTLPSFAEAKGFIEVMVKSDYNNWEGKDEYEERFLQLVEKRFA